MRIIIWNEKVEHLKEVHVHFPKQEILLCKYNITSSMVSASVRYEVVSIKMFLNLAPKVIIVSDDDFDVGLGVNIVDYAASEGFNLAEQDGNIPYSAIEGLERLAVTVVVVMWILLVVYCGLPLRQSQERRRTGNH
jgi:hypothetical protein